MPFVVGLKSRKGSHKGSHKGFLEGGFPEGAQNAALLESTAP